jgi:uncharacterized protein YceK
MWLPDSAVYFGSGKLAINLLLHRVTLAAGSPRSVVYSIGIYFLHYNRWWWPVLALNAVAVAWVLWLVWRSLLPRRLVATYLGTVVGLSLFTTASWYVCLMTPDILGAVLFLCLYLLVFAVDTLHRWERFTALALVFFTTTVHPTFPPIALGLCGLIALCGLLRRSTMRNRWRPLSLVLFVMVLAMLVQVAANRRIFGVASLNGDNPPRLMARAIADGPARDYLRVHCGALHWTLCKWTGKLTSNENDFLWDQNGVYQLSTVQEQAQLRSEEMPLVVSTIRAYPKQQILRSLQNFIWELMNFGTMNEVVHNDWMQEHLDGAVRGARESYERAEPIYNAMPTSAMRQVQEIGLPVSAVVVGILLPWVWRRGQARLLWLTVVVVFVVLTNALLTGVLAGPDPRYGGRIIWLVPFLAVIHAPAPRSK